MLLAFRWRGQTCLKKVRQSLTFFFNFDNALKQTWLWPFQYARFFVLNNPDSIWAPHFLNKSSHNKFYFSHRYVHKTLFNHIMTLLHTTLYKLFPVSHCRSCIYSIRFAQTNKICCLSVLNCSFIYSARGNIKPYVFSATNGPNCSFSLF